MVMHGVTSPTHMQGLAHIGGVRMGWLAYQTIISVSAFRSLFGMAWILFLRNVSLVSLATKEIMVKMSRSYITTLTQHLPTLT